MVILEKLKKTDFIDKDGSYILLIPDGIIKSFVAEFDGLVKGREDKFTRFWNYEAQFVVAGANGFLMSQQKDILNYFSYFRMYNCIIVGQNYDIIGNGYSRLISDNDADTVMKLVIYIRFPY
jgi:hypothetical protein